MSPRRKAQPANWALALLLAAAILGGITVLQVFDSRLVRPELQLLVVMVILVTCGVAGAALRPRPRPTFRLEQLLAMTPQQFEEATGEILGRFGYRLTVRGGAGDLSADLDGTDPDGLPTVVQCKRYDPGRRVTSPEVQQFIGMGHVRHRAQVLIYVTTADYTADARRLADEHGIALVTGSQLVELSARRAVGEDTLW